MLQLSDVDQIAQSGSLAFTSSPDDPSEEDLLRWCAWLREQLEVRGVNVATVTATFDARKNTITIVAGCIKPDPVEHLTFTISAR